MTTTQTNARNEINAHFYDAWKAFTPSIIGYIPPVEWQGAQPLKAPDKAKHWAHLSQQIVIDRQETLSVCTGEPGKKRFNTQGLIFVQLFCPKSLVNSFAKGGELCEVIKTAFRGKTTTPSKIWFRNARYTPLEPEDLYYRYNFVAEFEFDEIA